MRFSRRAFLAAAGAAGGLAVVGCGGGAGEPPGPDESAGDGSRQLGVVAPPQPQVGARAYDLVADDRDRVAGALAELAALRGELPVSLVVGVGSSLFDRPAFAARERPAELIPMPTFTGDRLDPARSDGDISIIVEGADPAGVVDSLDAIHAALGEVAALRWEQRGQSSIDPDAGTGRAPGRNLLGFRDGTANPDRSDAGLMDELVWAGTREPSWAVGGTYQVIRLIRLDLLAWNDLAESSQEAIIGRRKGSGAPLDGGNEADEPDYAADPDGQVTPLQSHIRLANPRTAATEPTRILRRSTNYELGAHDRGLLFTCYQSSLQTGFLSVQARLNGEPLSRYATAVGGGVFYVLPGPLTLA